MAKSNELVMTQVVKQKLGLDTKKEKGDTSNMAQDEIKAAEQDVAKNLKNKQTFEAKVYAYAVVEFEPKKYDIYKVSIDSDTDKAIAERLGKSYESESRAIMERQHLEAQDLVAKRRAEMAAHKELIKKLKQEGKDNA